MRRSIRKRLRTRDPTKAPSTSPQFRFLLRHTPCFLEDSLAPGPGRRRPPRRSERQQILLRRGLELFYEVRSSSMTAIAEKMSTALGEAGAEKATAAIANQMAKLLASDVLYATIVRPEINAVLAGDGIEGEDVPESAFVPDPTQWLDESAVSDALGSVSGASGTATPGVHGLGLLGTSVNGTDLTPEGTTSVIVEETPEVEVTVQNQGESTENGVTETVTPF